LRLVNCLPVVCGIDGKLYVGCCCAGNDGDADDAGDDDAGDDDDNDDDDDDDVAPITSTWPHLRCDVGLEEGEY